MFLELLTLAHYDVTPPIEGGDLLKAINHLHRSLDLIGGARKRVESGVLDGLFTSNDLAEGWFEVNCCRLYTEKAVLIEEYLQPAMGLIHDAKCMIDSLVAYGDGMTFHGKLSILSCLQDAEDGIRGVLEELEGWIGAKATENKCANCGRHYAFGDNYCAGCGQKLSESAAPV